MVESGGSGGGDGGGATRMGGAGKRAYILDVFNEAELVS